jgi:hypothetical protein
VNETQNTWARLRTIALHDRFMHHSDRTTRKIRENKFCFNESHNGKVKLSLCSINYAIRHEDIWRIGDIAPPFLISALDTSEWSASHPGHFIPPPHPGKDRGWGPQAVWALWIGKNISYPCCESNPGRPVRSPSLYGLSCLGSATTLNLTDVQHMCDWKISGIA